MTRTRRAGLLLAAIAAGALLAGCNRYDCEVVLEPDGSGTRTVVLELSQDIRGDAAAVRDMAVLFRMNDRPAPCERILDESGDRVTGFRCEYVAERLADWAGMGAGALVKGALRDDDAYGQVRLKQTVAVETGRTATGRSYTYRESLAWEGLWDVVAGFQARLLRERVASAHPDLGDAALAEVEGIVKGALLIAWRTMLDAEEGELPEEPLTTAMAEQIVRVVRREKPGADAGALRALVAGVVADSDNAMGEFLEENLPGVDAAVLTSYTLRVRMPGRIVASNADAVEDRTAVWQLDLSDPLETAVDLHVRSELSD